MPVYLFIGSNRYLKEKALSDLCTSLLEKSSRHLDYKVFHSLDASLSQVNDYIATVPFLSENRVAVIRNSESISSEDMLRLTGYAKNLIKSTHLIFETDDESFPARYHELAGCSKIKRFGDLSENELKAWIKKYIHDNYGTDKKIRDDAVRELIDLHGKNVQAISCELEKLAAFTGDRKEISTRDIMEISGRSLVRSAFELVDAIGKNKVDEALRVASDLITCGKKHYEIIGLLCWHLKRLLKARSLQSRGQSDRAIISAINLAGRYQEEFFRQAKLLSIPQLKNKLRTLLEADMDIKKTRFDPTLALEFVIIKLCLR